MAADSLQGGVIPVKFSWNGGGSEVYICGNFDSWESKKPLIYSHGEFTTTLELPEGQHEYKFIVDGRWCHDPNKPNVDNGHGSRNNTIFLDEKSIRATSTSTHPLKITLYNEINSRGIALPLTESVPDMSGVTRSLHFPVRSAHIDPGSVWTLYTGVNYTGQHITLRTDASLTFSSGYPIPAESFVVKPNMNDGSSDQHVSLREMAAIQLPVQSVKKMTAEIILYNNNGFRGSNLPLTGSRRSLGSFNDKTSSVIVVSGRWRLYTHSSYKGTSVELSRGSYLMDHLQQTVGNDAVSSVRLQSYD